MTKLSEIRERDAAYQQDFGPIPYRHVIGDEVCFNIMDRRELLSLLERCKPILVEISEAVDVGDFSSLFQHEAVKLLRDLES
jgi:hypothetical protein